MIHIARIEFYCSDRDCAANDAAPFSLLASPEEYPWLLLPAGAPAEVYRSRFARGQRALILTVDTVLAFRCWVAETSLRIDELALDWTIPKGDLCVYDVITEQRFRGRGLYPAALSWVRNLDSQGVIGRVWVYCDASNAASRRGIVKAGFDFASRATALVACGTAWWRSGTVPE